MSRLRRKRTVEDNDTNMVPVMNLFLVLIPFLLMSASFFQINVINTSVPVIANSAGENSLSKENIIKLTAVLEIKKFGMEISVISEDISTKELDKLSSKLNLTTDGKYPIEQMAICLKSIKEKYPKSDTLIIIPEETVLYDTIIFSMDAARQLNKELLFPNVVISGKV